MLPCDVNAILRAEGSAPMQFPYRKDDYALHLLLLGIGGGRPLSVLRQGPFRRLLEKPCVRRALAGASNGVLAPRHVAAALAPQREASSTSAVTDDPSPAVALEREMFLVTLARWGANDRRAWGSSYYQTSRPGQNLVVQLNFPASHDRAYRRLVGPGCHHPFAMYCHPARVEAPFTLAWARLDVDFDAREVLIEEVQCDWVREARCTREQAERWLAEGEPACLPFERCSNGTALTMLAYFERVLAKYVGLWAEGVLAAAIAFAYERLGLRRIYFHTFDGGNLMKRMLNEPPRSLYTDLPGRFCFVETRQAPVAFRTDRRVKMRSPSWYALELV
jgi:hypothetical protein